MILKRLKFTEAYRPSLYQCHKLNKKKVKNYFILKMQTNSLLDISRWLHNLSELERKDTYCWLWFENIYLIWGKCSWKLKMKHCHFIYSEEFIQFQKMLSHLELMLRWIQGCYVIRTFCKRKWCKKKLWYWEKMKMK